MEATVCLLAVALSARQIAGQALAHHLALVRADSITARLIVCLFVLFGCPAGLGNKKSTFVEILVF